jgi:hypothetical protein
MQGSSMVTLLLILALAILVFLCLTGPDVIGHTKYRR